MKEIEIKEEVIIGDIILEKGDKIRVLKERTDYINPKAYDMMKDDISFWVELKDAFKAGLLYGEAFNDLLSDMVMAGELDGSDKIKFINGFIKGI